MPALCAIALLTGGCSETSGQPTRSFSRDIADTRVFTAYRQAGTSRQENVHLSARARYIRVRIECSGDEGWVSVVLATRSGAIGCARPVGGGSFAFENAEGVQGSTNLRIRASKGARWSIAVDARARAYDATNS